MTPEVAPAPGTTPPRRPAASRRGTPRARPRPFVPVTPPPPRPRDRKTFLVALALGLGLNGAILWWLVVRHPDVVQSVQDTIVEFAVLEPPPPPPPAPEPPKPVREVVLERPSPPIPTTTAVEPPPEQAKPVFGISMSSTVAAGEGAFSVSVGNTVAKKPEDKFVPPGDVKPLREVAFQRLEEPPTLIADFRAEYPARAKAEGIEGTVILKLTITETGSVRDATVVRGVDLDLDAAARGAALRFRFKPGRVGGEPVVVTQYVHRYTWIIDE